MSAHVPIKISRFGSAAVAAAAALSVAGTIHAALNARRLRHLPAQPPRRISEPVSVLIPARDEETTIGDCLAGVLSQGAVPDLEILVGDDGSTDATAGIVTALATRDRRLRLLGIDPPAAGWLGKPNACAQLAAAASGRVLVFVDADVRLEPGAVAGAVAALLDADEALLSPWPRQLPGSFLDRLVQPLQQWSWLTTLPLGLAATSPRPELAAANGQFLLCTTEGYQRAGGHGAVRDRVLDDIELARAFKRAGLRTGLADASQVAACRMYTSSTATVDGYAKSLWTAFGGPVRGVAVTGALVAVYAAPPLAAVLARSRGARLLGLVGYLAGVAGRQVCARATGSADPVSSAAHPAGVAVLAGLMAISVHRHRAGRLTWRGRPV